MRYEIRYGSTFSTLFITLSPGESITAEAGAMASMSSAITMQTRFSGGFLTALLKKIFGGETLLVNGFANPTQQPLQIVLTQATIGDMTAVELTQQALCLQPGAYIAHAGAINLGVQWAGFASFFAGEGLFRLKATGQGILFLGAYGGLTPYDLDGELVVDSGHLVAYPPSIQMKLGLASGLIGSVTSGEGLVSRLSGQGRIYLQSRSLDGLVRYLNPKI
ncbi:MAG: TIGR00266 family protein [Cyanobacteriota bacterium]|nr:TIGR00266 family protein [Cyanobacteriota bacterium]